MEEITVSGRDCLIYGSAAAGTVILWAYHGSSGSGFERLTGMLKEMPAFADAAVAAFKIEDWDAELSPWAAPQAFGDMPFKGGGKDTLRWVTESMIPYLTNRYPGAETFYIMGYSLAGLFSLWSLYETELFSGCICCSGSLWIDGWDIFSASHQLKAPSKVYLSLGGKEEKTANPFMKKVGERVREQEKLLSKDANCRDSILEWNKGGHFADAESRLAKGIQWILSSH